MIMNNLVHKVVRVRWETDNIKTIIFQPENGEKFSFKAGQFISVMFDDLEPRSGKAYNLSSNPKDELASITVKAIGPFSQRVCQLEPGDTFRSTMACGALYEETDSDITLIGAGVGISPLMSIIRDLLDNSNHSKKVTLIYSNKTVKDICFFKELRDLNDRYDNFNLKLFVTREDSQDSIVAKGRFKIDQLIEQNHLEDDEFILCGHENFVTAVYQDLVSAGISMDNIFAETFFGSNIC